MQQPRAPYGRHSEARVDGLGGGRAGQVGAPYQCETYYGRPAVKPSHYRLLIATYFFTGGLAGAAQVVAAVAADPSDGMATLLIIERSSARGTYSVTKSIPLDVEGFRGAGWTQEVADLDGDGYDEVLCTGTLARGDGSEPARRYVVYTPRGRETYSLHLAPDSTGAHALRATWSPNTQGREAQLFRHALRQRALVN